MALWVPKFKYVNLTASGDIVAAVADKKIKVLALFVDEEESDNDAILTLKTSSDGATLAQFTSFDVAPKTLPFSRVGWLETVASDALYGTVAGTGPNLNINVVYVEVT